ncbi:MAG: UDP-N-acetylmuramate dehydrogenase, partial [Sulfurospirillum sp.]
MKRLIDFSKYSSIKIGSTIEVNVINSPIDLPKDAVIIGGANNLLVSPTPPPLFVLSKEFSYIKKDGEFLIIGAATKSGQIDSFCKKEGIGGFEYLSKLPGTLGGLIAMNAGMKEDEIFNSLVEVKTATKTLKKDEID